MWQNSDKVGQLLLSSCVYLNYDLLSRVNGEGSCPVFDYLIQLKLLGLMENVGSFIVHLLLE